MSPLPRMRTIRETALYFKETDHGTAITETMLRRLTATGELPSVRIGVNFLLNLDVVESYLRDGNTVQPAQDSARQAGR